MNLIRAAIDRPVATVSVVLMIVMFGALALTTIPIQLIPEVNQPTVQVRTNWPGAAPADSRRNRATYDRYELGSALKVLTAASAIEAGVAEEGTIYDARGSYKVADRRITDFHGENRFLNGK